MKTPFRNGRALHVGSRKELPVAGGSLRVRSGVFPAYHSSCRFAFGCLLLTHHLGASVLGLRRCLLFRRGRLLRLCGRAERQAESTEKQSGAEWAGHHGEIFRVRIREACKKFASKVDPAQRRRRNGCPSRQGGEVLERKSCLGDAMHLPAPGEGPLPGAS